MRLSVKRADVPTSQISQNRKRATEESSVTQTEESG